MIERGQYWTVENKKAGMAFISGKPMQAPLFDLDLLDGWVQRYKMFKPLISFGLKSDRLFLTNKSRSHKSVELLSDKILENNFIITDQGILYAKKLTLDDLAWNTTWLTTAFWGFMARSFIEPGHQDRSIVQQTVHQKTTTIAH